MSTKSKAVLEGNVVDCSRLDQKFLNLKEYVNGLHHSIHLLRAELRPHMPESEYEDSDGACEGKGDPEHLPDQGSEYSPTELKVHRLTNEVRRATEIIEYLRSKIVV
jgi:hypothetical protein